MLTLPKPSLGSVLARYNGVGPGFDILRVGLALAIFYSHAKWLSGSSASPDAVQHLASGLPGAGFTWLSVIGALKEAYHLSLVPMFFALSGFLVTGSAFRTRSVVKFLGLRLLRILPALSVEVALSALLIGAVFTTLPMRDYFLSEGLFRYFGNILGIVTFELPGVFLDNPVPGIVNKNLWTLPAEFYCYAVTAAVMLTGALFSRRVFLILFALFAAGCVYVNLAYNVGQPSVRNAYDAFVVVFYFFLGSMFFQWKDYIPHHWGLFIVCGLAAIVTLTTPGCIFVAPVFLVYVTLFVGTTRVPKIPFLQTGDYSYGVYLYGFPISQALIAMVPQLRGHSFAFAAIAGVATFAFAFASWHVVEKPFLSLRRHLT